jgi:cytochrome P450/NADPH-cytochrome P450 reductase
MITFLFAGHETTSGLLSFTFYYLLSNPATYAKAKREVDNAIGRESITSSHLARLPYLSAVLRESLRLSPTVPAVALAAKEDTILGGKYQVKAKAPIIALIASVHRDPLVYGSDADEFRPDRMIDSEFEERNRQFPNCWKPFGNGMRGCIGRFFAWQQALLVTAMLLQSFDLSMSDPGYRLKTKQTITMKPEGFRMRARLRPDVALSTLQRPLSSTTIADTTTSSSLELRAVEPSTVAVDVYYGSNSTCEQLASQLASHAVDHGFAIGEMGTLNAAKENLSRTNPVVIIAASYNGKPASNAAEFVAWVETLRCSELTGVAFAVFGCGHHDWIKTFLKVPKYLDGVLEERGGMRLAPMGTTDIAYDKTAIDFAAWEKGIFWPAVQKRYCHTDVSTAQPLEPDVQVKVCAPEATALRRDLYSARIVASETLFSNEDSVKKHLEIALPQNVSYRTGDRLAVLPQNPRHVVRRALNLLGLSGDSVLTISSATSTTLPLRTPMRAAEVFRAYVELQQTASKKNIRDMLEATDDETSIAELNRLADEAHYQEEVIGKRLSLLDLLERFPAVSISPGVFLSMQPPMEVRQYCISSSPLWNASCATVTSTHAQSQVSGLASAYLSSLVAGDEVSVCVKECADKFRMPEAADDVPLILIAAGTGMRLRITLAVPSLTVETGIAPFRSFIQERAAQLATGRTLPTALLFYGCRSRADHLYFDSFQRWQQLGAVAIYCAYSGMPDQSQGCRYVQDRISHDKTAVVKLLMTGARIAVCVPECATAGVRETLIDVLRETRDVRAQRAVLKGQCESTEMQPTDIHLESAWHVWKSASRTEI